MVAEFLEAIGGVVNFAVRNAAWTEAVHVLHPVVVDITKLRTRLHSPQRIYIWQKLTELSPHYKTTKP